MFWAKEAMRFQYSFFFNLFSIFVSISGRLPSISHRDSGVVSFCLIILAYLAISEVKAESKKINDFLMVISPIAWFTSAIMSGLLYEEIIQSTILTKILFDKLPDLEVFRRDFEIPKIVDYLCLSGFLGGLLCILLAQFETRITITTIMAYLISSSSDKFTDYEKIVTPFSLFVGILIGGLAIEEVSIGVLPFFYDSANAMWLNFLVGPIIGLVLFDVFEERIGRKLGIIEK